MFYRLTNIVICLKIVTKTLLIFQSYLEVSPVSQITWQITAEPLYNYQYWYRIKALEETWLVMDCLSHNSV